MFGSPSGKRTSIGLLGVGNIGQVHLQSARAMDDVEVTAAADAVPENRAHATSQGVDSVYDDFETLLENESLDAVIVALPPFLHRDAVELAAEQGAHAYVEKPFARSVAEARELIDIADEADVSLGVDHTIRYFPDVREVRDRYRDGRIGSVPYATISRVNNHPFSGPPVEGPYPSWPLDPDLAGGASSSNSASICWTSWSGPSARWKSSTRRRTDSSKSRSKTPRRSS
ncbi:Gfo/Idh/MocA family oxidoreductase [Haloarculaceae archaeon H-GB2-1]|nr:Gfo/Idh/MocA family oxidoreductase [Haloarculaceae archaeon H-GB11]MEA5409973.1 Gfo/Idh/MocA family oxidoreductase [Haloarculaceae archaeon H-GB2-1]